MQRQMVTRYTSSGVQVHRKLPAEVKHKVETGIFLEAIMEDKQELGEIVQGCFITLPIYRFKKPDIVRKLRCFAFARAEPWPCT